MTKEEKELLLKDLCGRLPYGVHLFTNSKHHHRLLTIGRDIDYDEQYWINGLYDIDEVKPYLRPMSSMTEEEKKEFAEFCDKFQPDPYWYPEKYADYVGILLVPELIDWLNKNMFDYRELIPKGLALETPEGMYKVEE